MVELMAALGIFALILVLFAALFPVATRGTGEARAYAQAAFLCQRKIDQLRQSGYSRLNTTSLKSLGIIDTTSNTDGTYSFNIVDDLVDNGTAKGYFSSGTVSSISFKQSLTQLGSSAPPLSRAILVTVKITWPGGGFHGGSFETHTIISSQ